MVELGHRCLATAIARCSEQLQLADVTLSVWGLRLGRCVA